MKVRMIVGFSLLVHILWAGNYVPIKFGWPTFDHDTGNCILTVTCVGAIGGYDTLGGGFWYPKWVNQTLYCASMAAGNSIDYVIDYFNNRDWRALEDSLYYHIPPEFGLQEVDGLYDDHGPTSQNPRDLQCFQYSVADAAPDCDDFVIIEFIYENKGSAAINALYSAIFCDFDIASATDNYGKIDSIHRTAYMQPNQVNENPTVGMTYLGSKPQPQPPIANLSVIDHALYVYPGFTDTIKFKFMNGTYHQSESNRPYDWSVIVSVGPFDLPVGTRQHVAFAIVGGLSNAHYLENCQHAIEQYDSMWPGITEETAFRLDQKLRIYPNPSHGPLNLDLPSDVKEITLFDAAGRRLHRLSPSPHLRLTLPPGIYFLQIRSPSEIKTEKLVVLR